MRREAISRMGAVLLGAVLAPAAAFPNGAGTLRLQAAGIELARLSPLTFEMTTPR